MPTGDNALKMLEFLCFLEEWRSGDIPQGAGAQQEGQIPAREYLESWLASEQVLATCWCQELDLPPGATYGEAAQRVLDSLDEPAEAE